MSFIGQPGPILIQAGHIDYETLGIEGASLAETATAVGPGQSESLGCGFARFEKCAFPWMLSYDETMYIIEGAIEIEHGGGVLLARPGDVVFVPRGSAVEYRIPARCLLFYATYPVDWGAAQATAAEDGEA